MLIKATRLSRISAHRALFYQLAGSAPLLLILSPLLGEPGLVVPTPLIWSALAFQTVVVAFFSYLCWFGLIARYPVFKLSAVTFLTPTLFRTGIPLPGEVVEGKLLRMQVLASTDRKVERVRVGLVERPAE